MLHAPISESKQLSHSSRSQSASGGVLCAPTPRQQFDRFQSTYGNQRVLAAQEVARSAAAQRGEPHGDKKKSDDNGGPGMPDGLKQFNPQTPNGAASGAPTDFVTVEKPQKDEWDNGFDR